MFLGILFSTSYLSNVVVIYVTKHGGCGKDGILHSICRSVAALQDLIIQASMT